MPLPSELREGRAGGCLSKDAGSDSPSPRLPHNGASIVIQRLELSCARRGNGMDAGGLPPQVGANVESWGVQAAQNSLPPSLRGGSPLHRKAMASKSQNHPRIIPVSYQPPTPFWKSLSLSMDRGAPPCNTESTFWNRSPSRSPSSATYELSGLEQITEPLCACTSSSLKRDFIAPTRNGLWRWSPAHVPGEPGGRQGSVSRGCYHHRHGQHLRH